MIKSLISTVVLFTFVAGMICPPGRIYAQGVSQLPVPGTMVSLSPAFEPVLIKGLKVHPENPFKFDFIIDTGTQTRGHDFSRVPKQAAKHGSNDNESDPELKAEADRLIKYFLAA